MAKHMLVIWTNGEAWGKMSQEEQQGLFVEYFQYTQWLIDQGWFLVGDPLKPEAKTVRVRDGETQVTDGPYAETKEFLGGYYVLECTQEQALEAAARIPDARFGAIEVHEVVPVEAPAGMEMPH
ncbi:MAG: YciI family protein [Actinomycetota bacterium]|nr:YciI family protein [Actinomycetota bacterium]